MEEDLFLDWATDFVEDPTGDLRGATGWDLVRQRITQFVLTNPAIKELSGVLTPPDYHWDTSYGLGLRSYVDEQIDQGREAQMRDILRTACLQDPAIDPSFQPQVTVQDTVNGSLTLTAVVQLKSGQTQTVIVGVP